ncbi:MAG: calcium:proton antiporter [Chthoniobacterales bacterium]
MSSSEKTSIATKHPLGFTGFLRSEIALFLGLASAAVFLWLGDRLQADARQREVFLFVVLVWLFVGVLWSAISVVRHADCLALKFGEPYGTLILTLAAISIEVMMISVMMLHGANNPALARDMMFAVLMIALNGLIGLSLLLGGLRHREQQYNLQGSGAYLNTIMTLAVLVLVLPDFTTSLSAPRLNRVQEVFLIVVSLALYAIFLFLQVRRHSSYFQETAAFESSSGGGGHGHLVVRSTLFHVVMLIFYLVVVVILAEKFAVPLDDCIERFGMPQAFGGAIVASLVLAPEALSGIQAAMGNQLQRSVNILHGSVLASIGLTIPAVLIIGITTGRAVTLGIGGGNLPLLVLTLGASIVTFGSGRTSVLQGCIHLLLFAVFILLIFSP